MTPLEAFVGWVRHHPEEPADSEYMAAVFRSYMTDAILIADNLHSEVAEHYLMLVAVAAGSGPFGEVLG